MPPRPAGQLDQISQAIGRLEGKLGGIDAYIHEREHNIANLSSKVDGLSAQITREVTRMKAELQVQMEAMDKRIALLEAKEQRQTGAKNLTLAIMQSPLIAWLFALAVIAWTALKGEK